MFSEQENLCDGCKHCEKDSNNKPCNSCMQWVEGYLTATNYENKYLDELYKGNS